MQKMKEIAESIRLYPRLRLMIKEDGRAGESTGPHLVRFLEEPQVITGKDKRGNPRKELKFFLEEDEKWYRWQIPILNDQNQPHYLFERLMDIHPGEVRVLEMKKRGANNYVDVRLPDEIDEKQIDDTFTSLEKEQIGDIEETDPTDKPPF